MRRDAQGGLCLLLALLAFRLGLTDAALVFVKPSLRPLLVISGFVLLVLALTGLVARHDHPTSRTGWLLVLPVLAVFLAAPAPLGSFAADRQSASRSVERARITEPLPAAQQGAVTLTMRDFLLRAYNADPALSGAPVRLTGFLSRAGSTVLLTRFRLTCCAADAIAMRVRLAAVPQDAPLGQDAWVQVVGLTEQGEVDEDGELVGMPTVEVTTLTRIDRPAKPYEG